MDFVAGGWSNEALTRLLVRNVNSRSHTSQVLNICEYFWELILIFLIVRMHNNLPDETQLPNGQKFELITLALLGVPSMAEKFAEVSNSMKQLSFDPADYVCLKFILLLNSGKYYSQRFKYFLIKSINKLLSFQRKFGIWTTEPMFKSRVSKFTKYWWSTVTTATPMFP